MKTLLLLIALFFSITLFASKDSTMHISVKKPGKCNLLIVGKYKNRDTIPLTEITDVPFIHCDCGEILNFTVSFPDPNSGVYLDYSNNGNGLSTVVTNELTKKYTWIIIKNIHYQATDGQVKASPGITIIVKK